MAIKELLEFIGKDNIVPEILEMEKGDELLATIGERIRRQFDEDWRSMDEWVESVQEGIKLMKQEWHGKSTPWENASNFKSPILSEASISFGDKATLEILRARNLVKADIIGKDAQGLKKETAERVTEGMNYQVNYQMEDWRDDQERLLYVLPNVGSIFKKTVFDPLEGTTVSHIIQYPDFAVNQATTSLKKSRSFTQILAIDQNGVLERQASGLWIDEPLYPKDAEGDEGSNEAAETIDAEANPDRFLEQQCFADLDGDGYEEPYIITVHEQTQKVVRIVARYDFRSFMVKTEQGRTMNLVSAIQEQTKELAQNGGDLPEVVNLNDFTLIRIEPIQQITKYGFIPAPDGTFLDLGYAHLLGAIVQGVNAGTNQLTDSGKLRNVGGGFLAKGFRKKMGPMRIKPGEYLSTEIKASDLQNGILPNPAPEPSEVLFALVQDLKEQARGLASTVDAGGQITANTAPTTALAMIQEALISTSAHMSRVLRAMSKEFQILFRLNQTTFDPELYKIIMDDPKADANTDFNNQSLDIKPTASPEMSSKLQRIQLSAVEVDQIPNVIQAGGNPLPIIRNFFERIGSDNVDEIFPEQPTDQQAQEIARFAELQKQENDINIANLELSKLQTEVLMREQDRLDAKTKIDIDKAISSITKDRADMILTLEKAETEDVKNQISKYTTQQQGVIDLLTAIGADNDARTTNTRNQGPA